MLQTARPGLCSDEAGPATTAKLDYLQNYLQIKSIIYSSISNVIICCILFTIFTAYHAPVPNIDLTFLVRLTLKP